MIHWYIQPCSLLTGFRQIFQSKAQSFSNKFTSTRPNFNIHNERTLTLQLHKCKNNMRFKICEIKGKYCFSRVFPYSHEDR